MDKVEERTELSKKEQLLVIKTILQFFYKHKHFQRLGLCANICKTVSELDLSSHMDIDDYSYINAHRAIPLFTKDNASKCGPVLPGVFWWTTNQEGDLQRKKFLVWIKKNLQKS